MNQKIIYSFTDSVPIRKCLALTRIRKNFDNFSFISKQSAIQGACSVDVNKPLQKVLKRVYTVYAYLNCMMYAINMLLNCMIYSI